MTVKDTLAVYAHQKRREEGVARDELLRHGLQSRDCVEQDFVRPSWRVVEVIGVLLEQGHGMAPRAADERRAEARVENRAELEHRQHRPVPHLHPLSARGEGLGRAAGVEVALQKVLLGSHVREEDAFTRLDVLQVARRAQAVREQVVLQRALGPSLEHAVLLPAAAAREWPAEALQAGVEKQLQEHAVGEETDDWDDEPLAESRRRRQVLRHHAYKEQEHAANAERDDFSPHVAGQERDLLGAPARLGAEANKTGMVRDIRH